MSKFDAYGVLSSDELKNFFSKYGKVVEHQIIRDHETHRSRGFGFVIFDNDEVVDEMLTKGNMIDMAGTQVSLFKCTQRNLHVNQFLFIMEHASLHSPFILVTYILRFTMSSFLRYLIKGHFCNLLLNLYLIKGTVVVICY